MNRDYDESLSDYNQAIKLDADMVWAYMGRGAVWVQMDEPDRAISDFDRAIQLDPKLAIAYGDRGIALLYRGREAEAKTDFDRCLALDPDLKNELQTLIQTAREYLASRR